MIPLKPIKEILKQDCPYHVSSEAVILLRDQLWEIAQAIKEESIKEFEEYNNHRHAQGLPPKKRLNRWAVKKASEKVLKHPGFNDMGLQSSGAVSLGGKMLASKESTKSAKEDDSRMEASDEL